MTKALIVQSSGEVDGSGCVSCCSGPGREVGGGGPDLGCLGRLGRLPFAFRVCVQISNALPSGPTPG